MPLPSFRSSAARHPDAIAALLLIAVVSIVFAAVLAGSCFYERDLTVYHFPMKSVVRDAMRSGEFPLWNPRYSGGQPLAANPAYELFYPPQWLVLLPDFFLGFRLHILLHFYLAALGMYAFCRSLHLGPPAAFFGGLLFGLGGPMLSLVNVLPFLFAMAWVPLILLFARRMLREPNRRDFAIAALLLGVQATVGEPVTLLQTWALVGVYALVRRSWKSVVLAGSLIVTGALLAAVQLLPAADHTGDSVRHAGFTYQLVTEWSTRPARTQELLFPGSLRRITEAGEPKVKSFYNGRPAFIADLSLGVCAAIFLVASLFVRTRRMPLLVGGVVAAWYVAAGGPLWRMLYAAGVRSIRYPEKFLLTSFVLLVLLAAFFADRLFSGDVRARRAALASGIAWTVLAAFLALGAAPAFWRDLALRGAFVTVAVWLLVKPKVRVAAMAALVLFTIVDLARFRDEIAPVMPRTFFEKPPVLAALPPGSRIFHAADWQWFANDPNALPYFADPARYWLSVRNGAFPALPAAWGYELPLQQDVDETTLQPSADFLAAVIRAWQQTGQWPPLLDSMAAITHRAELIPPPGTNPVQLVPAGDHPRIYFAEQLEPIGGPHDFSDKLASAAWPDHTAFVDGEAFVPAPASIRSSTATWTHMDADVTADGRTLLVFATTPHKYWRATLDGVPVPVRTANLASMAIEVPAGPHRIALRYRNPLVLAGGIVSLITLLALALTAFRS